MMNKFFVFFFFFVLCNALLSGCTTEKVLDNEQIEDSSYGVATSSGGSGNPSFLIKNATDDELFKVEHEGKVKIPQGQLFFDEGNITDNSTCIIIKGAKSTWAIC